jgi:hypothetical protein
MTPENLGSSPDPRAVAAYIASVAGELAKLAKSQHLDALGYILDMARMEADQIAKGFGGAEDEVA